MWKHQLRQYGKALDAPEDTVGVVLLLVVFTVMLAAVLFRYLLNDSLTWAEELVRFGFVGLVYSGIATGFRRRAHIRIDMIDLMLPRLAPTFRVVNWLISLIFLIFLLVQTVEITKVLRTSRSAALELPMAWLYWLVAAGIAMGILRLLWIGLCAVRSGR